MLIGAPGLAHLTPLFFELETVIPLTEEGLTIFWSFRPVFHKKWQKHKVRLKVARGRINCLSITLVKE